MEGHYKSHQQLSSSSTNSTNLGTQQPHSSFTLPASSTPSTSTCLTTANSCSKLISSPSLAEEKRSKFQRSGGSRHAGSWCSLAINSSLGNSAGSSTGAHSNGGLSTAGSASCESPSHHHPQYQHQHSYPSGSGAGSSSAAPSRSSSNAKNSIISSSKSTSSNKSQSVGSIVLSSLLSEVADVISEDERPILPGVPVRAANLPALVHICVRAFDYKGEILEELENFPRVLFLMHQWFCPSTELALLFIHHYKECSGTLAPCQDLHCHCRGGGSGTSTNCPAIISTNNTPSTNGNSTASTVTTTAANSSTTSPLKTLPNSRSSEGAPISTSSTSITNHQQHYHSSQNVSATSTTTVTASTSTSSYSSSAKARIKMMKRSSGSSSNNSSSTSSGSLSHLSQEELLHQQQQHQIPPRCRTTRYKASVCQALRYWIQSFPLHFDVDDHLYSTIRTFANELEQEGQEDWARWLDLSEIPAYEWLRNSSLKDPETPRPYRKVSLIFNHLEPVELARHVTYLEHKIMRRITFQDFKQYAENGTLEDNPVLERSVSLFNGLSQWIQYVVLNRPTPSQRSDVIAKFVHVAKNLRQLQNFNSLMGVVGSLSHSALARLSKTMECVPAEEKKALAELATLVSSSNNFRQYRRALNQCKGFKIPILGVHLKDLISLHTALPDYVENGLINFRKMTQLYLIFKELQDLQKSMPPAEANDDLLNTLKLSLEFNYSEDEIYELSLSREPRASNSISPTRGPGQQDNANGSYEKQVQTMVDAVFRNYDSNRDGFISRDEFQALSNNFPAIDAFFVLDENRDGMISKLELERYLRNRKNAGASHNFHEQTYFKPTFCIHCSGLLWGLIKQGVKCRNCGVNAHKCCKDYMLYECKMGQLFFFNSPEPHAKRRGFRIRKKSSSQSESGSPPSPKYFNSLEQLSLSTESSEMPVSASSCGIHTYGSSSSICTNPTTGGGGGNSSISGSLTSTGGLQAPSSHLIKDQQSLPQQHSTELPTTTKGANKGLQPQQLHGTPKGTRRFSILGSNSSTARTSSSVPSSPKLGGFSSISIPILSPCRSFLGHLTNNSSSSSSNTAAGGSGGSGTSSPLHKQKNTQGKHSSGGGGKGLSSIFGSSGSSSAESPSRKPKFFHSSPKKQHTK